VIQRTEFPADRHDPLALFLNLSQQVRQVVQLRRAGHQVDERQALEHDVALGLGHAADDPQHQPRAVLLEAFQLVHLAERALLGMLPHRAGVQQDDVGFLGTVRDDIP